MRQIQILVTCDACAAWHQSENSTDVETVPVSAGQTLDLCGSHRTDLAPLLALIAEWGQRPERNHGGRKRAAATAEATSAPLAPAQASNAPSKRGGKRARQRRANASQAALTLVCPLCASELANSDSLGTHLRAMHHTTGQAVYGGTCPVCNHDGSPRGLGTHAGQAHSISSVALLFAQAQAEGDPHGVVAGRAKVLAAQT